MEINVDTLVSLIKSLPDPNIPGSVRVQVDVISERHPYTVGVPDCMTLTFIKWRAQNGSLSWNLLLPTTAREIQIADQSENPERSVAPDQQ